MRKDLIRSANCAPWSRAVADVPRRSARPSNPSSIKGKTARAHLRPCGLCEGAIKKIFYLFIDGFEPKYNLMLFDQWEKSYIRTFSLFTFTYYLIDKL